MEKSKGTHQYKKIMIDNVVCRRRFHLGLEEGGATVSQVEVPCPHCGMILYTAQNSAPVELLREENLVNAPDGSQRTLNECHFLKK